MRKLCARTGRVEFVRCRAPCTCTGRRKGGGPARFASITTCRCLFCWSSSDLYLEKGMVACVLACVFACVRVRVRNVHARGARARRVCACAYIVRTRTCMRTRVHVRIRVHTRLRMHVCVRMFYLAAITRGSAGVCVTPGTKMRGMVSA